MVASPDDHGCVLCGLRPYVSLMGVSLRFVPCFVGSEALFRYEKILVFATVALSFVCDKYCLIID